MFRKKVLLLLVVALVTVVATILFYLPASWVGSLIEKQTAGRIVLGDVQGSFWRGSAFIGVAADKNSAVTPLFPGRFAWKISPTILLGQLSVEVENSAALSAPVHVTGNFTQWRVSPASLNLPSERLEGLGAPLNTIGPTGKILLSWGELDLMQIDAKLMLNGRMQLDLSEMASRASSIKPLGSYKVTMQWRGEVADLDLTTSKGPMMLEGIGKLNQGRFQFSGKAYAESGQEEKMANLLNLLGRRRQEGDKQIIALEYK
jgi:general secretion pathway protein N